MVDTAERKYQKPWLKQVGSLIFLVLLVGCLPASILFSSRVARASSAATAHGKPPLSSSNTTSPPTATVSRYMTHKDTPTILNTDGCNQATAFVGGVVILDFGATVQQNGAYGTFLPGTSTGFVSNISIQALVKQYLKGYASCDTNTSG